MTWTVVFLEEVAQWFATLPQDAKEDVTGALEALISEGPMLGRPFVDHIKGSKIQNMKELRPQGSNLRVVFVFDPQREAILLVGGDKTGTWNDWYPRNIKIAEKRYRKHLANLGKQGEK